MEINKKIKNSLTKIEYLLTETPADLNIKYVFIYDKHLYYPFT